MLNHARFSVFRGADEQYGRAAGGRTGVSAYGRDELFEISRRGMDATDGTYEGRQS
jgi:hypothetical protein